MKSEKTIEKEIRKKVSLEQTSQYLSIFLFVITGLVAEGGWKLITLKEYMSGGVVLSYAVVIMGLILFKMMKE